MEDEKSRHETDISSDHGEASAGRLVEVPNSQGKMVAEAVRREPSPSAAILYGQSVRTTDQNGAENALMRARRSPGANGAS